MIKIIAVEPTMPNSEIITDFHSVFKVDKGIMIPICIIAGAMVNAPNEGKIAQSRIFSGNIPAHFNNKKLTIDVKSIGTLAFVHVEIIYPNAIRANNSVAEIIGSLLIVLSLP